MEYEKPITHEYDRSKLISNIMLPNLPSKPDIQSSVPLAEPVMSEPPKNSNTLADYQVFLKNLAQSYNFLENPLAPSENKSTINIPEHRKELKDPDGIESDSEELKPNYLNFYLSYVNKDKKKFNLKKDNNICITYYKKSFIMAACSKSRRQVFELVDASKIAVNMNKSKATAYNDDERILREVHDSLDDKNDDTTKIVDKIKGTSRKKSTGKNRTYKRIKHDKDDTKTPELNGSRQIDNQNTYNNMRLGDSEYPKENNKPLCKQAYQKSPASNNVETKESLLNVPPKIDGKKKCDYILDRVKRIDLLPNECKMYYEEPRESTTVYPTYRLNSITTPGPVKNVPVERSNLEVKKLGFLGRWRWLLDEIYTKQ